MAVGAGRSPLLQRLSDNARSGCDNPVGYVYALGGLSAAAVGLSAPLISRQLGVALWRRARPAVDRPFLSCFDHVSEVATRRRDAHRAADKHLDGLADRFDLHCPRSTASAGRGQSLYGLRAAASGNFGYSAASLVAGVPHREFGYKVTFFDLIVFTALAMAISVGYYSQHPRVRSGRLSSALPRWRRGRPPLVDAFAEEAP